MSKGLGGGAKLSKPPQTPPTKKTIGGVEKMKNEKSSKKPYVIIRTYSAGVFAGNLEKRNGKEVELSDARRIWYWDGAASLSQLAMEGTSKPENCKFPIAVKKVILTEAIEIIPTTKKAEESIKAVKIWQR